MFSPARRSHPRCPSGRRIAARHLFPQLKGGPGRWHGDFAATAVFQEVERGLGCSSGTDARRKAGELVGQTEVGGGGGSYTLPSAKAEQPHISLRRVASPGASQQPPSQPGSNSEQGADKTSLPITSFPLAAAAASVAGRLPLPRSPSPASLQCNRATRDSRKDPGQQRAPTRRRPPHPFLSSTGGDLGE